MDYITFHPTKNKFKIAVLTTNLNQQEIHKHYIKPVEHLNDEFIAFKIKAEKKTLKTEIEKQLNIIYSRLLHIEAEYLIVTNADFFKIIIGKNDKVTKYYGHIVKAKNFNIKVIYVPSSSSVFFNPANTNLINSGLTAIDRDINNIYVDPGNNTIKYYEVVEDHNNIEKWLDYLRRKNFDLTTDIETFSLKHYDAGIGSITFCWSKHKGIVIPVDIINNNNKVIKQTNYKTRNLLKNFFMYSKNKFIWHNAAFDVYVLIYQLFMEHELDNEGLLFGLEVMLKNYEDTQLISYCALNSCAEYKLSLKHLSHEFSGNYAVEDINDITKIPYDKLLKYNFIDGLSTYYVYEKYYPLMVQDNQLNFYETIFKPALKDNIQMQLTGLPVDIDKVNQVELELNQEKELALSSIINKPIIMEFNTKLKENWVINKNNTLKVKKVTIDDCPSDITLNLNSPIQLCSLLYDSDFMNLPVIEKTDKGNPATGKDVLSNLVNHTNNKEYKEIIDSIKDYKLVDKIISTFIPVLKNARKCNDNWHYIYGNFKLGGTVSGRLSCKNP